MSNFESLTENLGARFNKEAASGLDLTYTFQIKDGDSFALKVCNQTCQILQNPSDHQSNVTLEADKQTWESIWQGSTSPQIAFMTGKLSVKGDMGAALKLASLFNLS